MIVIKSFPDDNVWNEIDSIYFHISEITKDEKSLNVSAKTLFKSRESIEDKIVFNTRSKNGICSIYIPDKDKLKSHDKKIDILMNKISKKEYNFILTYSIWEEYAHMEKSRLIIKCFVEDLIGHIYIKTK